MSSSLPASLHGGMVRPGWLGGRRGNSLVSPDWLSPGPGPPTATTHHASHADTARTSEGFQQVSSNIFLESEIIIMLSSDEYQGK